MSFAACCLIHQREYLITDLAWVDIASNFVVWIGVCNILVKNDAGSKVDAARPKTKIRRMI
jgi:hypothetical protein